MAKTLNVYKSNLGTFVRTSDLVYSEAYYKPEDYRFNGLDRKFPSVRGWVFLEGIHEVNSLEKMSSPVNKKIGYKLKAEELASDKIPVTLSIEDVEEHLDEDDRLVWNDQYETIRGLYDVVYEQIPGEFKQEDIVVNVLQTLNIEKLTEPVKMKVSLHNEGTYGSHKSVEMDLSSIVRYDDFEKMLTPEFLLHERPCSLSSQQVYMIVRDYIKHNINPKVARITSDYDFCFTVKRVVKVKPFSVQNEIRTPKGNSYKPPRFKTSTLDSKQVEIFEMTHAGNRYRDYTIIDGWKANNLLEMKEQIENYLKELMFVINMDVAECPHCNGTGHILNDKIEANRREGLV